MSLEIEEIKVRGKRKMSKFEKELEALINKHSLENASDTPDFILAKYLCNCLRAFNLATNRRVNWYLPHDSEG